MSRVFFNKPVVRIYADPGAAETADEAFYGQSAEILSLSGGLARVKTEYGYEGFARARSLSKRVYAPNAVITSSFADAADAPQTRARAAARLVMGSRLEKTGEESGYARVRLISGEHAFVRLAHIGELPKRETALSRGAVIETALSFLGAPYRWGGKTRAGIDCSGLAFMSYYMNGVTIYRDAKMAEGFPVRPVPLSKAGAGDLLFFPGHVAVFIGGGRVIHSSSANGGVKTEPLSALPEPGAAGSVFGAEPSALRRAHLRLRR